MLRTKVLIISISLTAAFLLSGCVIARDISAGMDPKTQDKFADKVACKVIKKLKAEQCCPHAASAAVAEPNKPAK